MTDPAEGITWVREPDDDGDATIEANWLFQLRRERFRSRRSGKSHDYYVMHLADAVYAIAITPEKQVVMVRQFRAGSRHDSLEPPGGLLEPDEDPCEAGARELLEETGYAGDHAVFLGSAWSNPSIMTSKIHIVVVENARHVAEPRPDANEEVTIELVPAHTIPRMIRDGRIDHALSVMSLLWWLGAQWPNPLAKPGPARPITIGRIMTVIAVVAVILAAVTRLGSLRSGLFEVALLGAFAFFGLRALFQFNKGPRDVTTLPRMGDGKS